MDECIHILYDEADDETRKWLGKGCSKEASEKKPIG